MNSIIKSRKSVAIAVLPKIPYYTILYHFLTEEQTLSQNIVRLCSVCHAKAHGNSSLVKLSLQSIAKKRERGEWAGGTPPYGYRIERGNVVINEDEAEIVRLIYKWRFTDGMTMDQIAGILNFMAIPTQRNGKKWVHNTVRKILRNEMYFGDYKTKYGHHGKCFPQILPESFRDIVTKFNEKHLCKTMLRVFSNKVITYSHNKKEPEYVEIANKRIEQALTERKAGA
ncbi:recombinase family protein [Aneurinibacillus aneurinilyticus]|uniref:recombinase family protein n=1 Tax=Aneurinibacillus aneurinilyticus TaxID=1391 RepID=UPI00366D1BCA